MEALPEPLRLGKVFDDPEHVLACARSSAPHRLLSVVDRSYEGDHYAPWFRAYWVVPGKIFSPEAEALLDEPRLDAFPRGLLGQLVAPFRFACIERESREGKVA